MIDDTHHATYQNVELWTKELLEAGWKPKTSVIWKSPSGSLHLGPHGAWKTMKALKNDSNTR